MNPHFRRGIASFKSRRGIAAVEFALTLPILVLLLLGVIETTRWLLMNQKIDKIAYSLADLVAQGQEDTVYTADLDVLAAAATQIMHPYIFRNGQIIFSAVRKSPNLPAKVLWQYRPDTGPASVSRLGRTNDDATLPDGFVLQDNEMLIAAEVYFEPYSLFVGAPNIFAPMYRRAFYAPRVGTLQTLVDNN